MQANEIAAPEYHKIQTVFLRDPETNHKTLINGQWSLPEFEYLKDNVWVFTEKVDGTNIRVMFDGETVTFGGRTNNAMIPALLMVALQAQFLPLVGHLKEVFPDGGCLYGEGFGAKIQKGGGNYRPDQGFVLFDVRVGGWWLNRADVLDVADKLDITAVPARGGGSLAEMLSIVRKGFKSAWGDFQAEGIVARPATELCTRAGKRIITKLKTKDFPREPLQ